MKRFSGLKDKFNIFGSASNGIFIEIRGRNLLIAEGYCRIDQYTENKITLTSKNSTVSVSGEGLLLKHLSRERIAVEGRINSFAFI